MRGWLLVAVAVLVAGCAGKGPSAGQSAGDDPDATLTRTTYQMNAALEPPVTRYNVTSSMGMLFQGSFLTELGAGYTFDWSTTNKCGRFEATEGRAVWHHGDDTDCPHDSPVHPGTVTVVVGNASESQASTGYFTCEFKQGSASGTSDPCFVSSVAPAGREAAKGTSIPGVAPLVLASLAAVLALVRRRS